MDNFVDERDYELLNKDKHTFSVMARIIGLDCKIRLTDHKDIILCYTGEPFPVWICTEDDASDHTHTDGREKTNNEVDNFLRHYRSPFPCYPGALSHP